ncbi:hypothetical protein Bca52824_001164 [Brassica carinata]|uniref:Uncharacterized protein n=1 Tax=Brassica carinata TaxID=52824 RepID=A0A8X7WFS1_BRACI|nr:hypothetical protein Bca52824_001164 [Brassica carinata]
MDQQFRVGEKRRLLSFLQAQTEAVNLLRGAQTQSNPENTVILTMAGREAVGKKGEQVLVESLFGISKITGEHLS